MRRVAAAVCDGERIDWKALAPEVADDPTGSLNTLRALDELFAGAIAPRDQPRPRRLIDMGAPYAVVVLVATAYTGAGMAGFVVGTDSSPPPAYLQFIAVLTYAVAALFLGWSARSDARANYLAGFFLIVACSFSARFVDDAVAWLGAATAPVTVVLPEVFLPAFLWRFVREFPRVVRFNRWESVCTMGSRLSWVAGILLMAWPSVGRDTDSYWFVLFGLLVPALPVALVRTRDALPLEREKVRAFTVTVVSSVGLPIVVILTEAIWPAFDRLLDPSRMAGLFYSIVLAFPLAASWVVVTKRPLEVRFVMRRSLQYMLARSTLRITVALLTVLLSMYLYRNRTETLDALLSSAASIAIIVSVAAILVLLATRGRLLEIVERAFGRGIRDYPGALAQLSVQLRGLKTVHEIARAVEGIIARVLEPEVISIYLADPGHSRYTAVRSTHRSLAFSTSLAGTLVESADLLNLTPDAGAGWFGLLPTDERAWLADGAYTLLVPLIESGGVIAGFIALGASQRDDAFTVPDEKFLAAVAGSAVLAFGAVPRVASGISAAEMAAFACRSCGRVADSGDTCTCGGTAELTLLPRVLGGKFTLERKVGAGGMGVVYRAHDGELDRPVALKTLPRVSPEATFRLRREARTMARVSHPGLATIYGFESWRAFPVLVVEYLEGGTLADRLRRETLLFTEVRRIGVELANTLAYLHDAGWLHRDIKPSNIGFTNNGKPKLLDFGLATFLTDPPVASLAEPRSEGQADGLYSYPSGALVGTPLYLAPELVDGETATPLSDLWAFALTLYEALAGTHPYKDASPEAILHRIAREDPRDLRTFRPECSQSVAAFFSSALSRDRSKRPQSALAFAEQLQRAIA